MGTPHGSRSNARPSSIEVSSTEKRVVHFFFFPTYRRVFADVWCRDEVGAGRTGVDAQGRIPKTVGYAGESGEIRPPGALPTVDTWPEVCRASGALRARQRRQRLRRVRCLGHLRRPDNSTKACFPVGQIPLELRPPCRAACKFSYPEAERWRRWVAWSEPVMRGFHPAGGLRAAQGATP